MSLTSGVKLHIHLLNVVVRFIVFLTSATLIFRGTDIPKCSRESRGIRDNESRLYIIKYVEGEHPAQTTFAHADLDVCFSCMA